MTRRHVGRVGVVVLALAAVSCGSTVRDGSGTSFLIINGLEAASGADPDTFGNTLRSDVLTVVDDVPTVFNDVGRVTFTLGLKDPGTASSPNSPTQNQYITINRYRVQFARSDGRSAEGVDVPYAFEGAFTATVTGGETTAGFNLVRHTAKGEAPLSALARNGVVISTIATVTFYGRDQTGRDATATGRIGIDFGNFGDPN